MTTTKVYVRRKMKQSLFMFGLFAVILVSCNKTEEPKPVNHLPFSHSSEVLDKWMTLQIRLMRNATGISNHGLSRHFAYSGVAALEALAPGLPAHQKWSEKWNNLNGLPLAQPGTKFYYPANVNAALAAVNKAMFPNASVADKAAIDSLESALYAEFSQTQVSTQLIQSSQYGKAVANAILNWAASDGSVNANASYTIPVGVGLWKPTPSGFSAPATPYWGNNRTIILGSTTNAQMPAPIPYSAQVGSPFHDMVKQIYIISQNLTDDQKEMAIFWKDVPGATTPGHWLSILQQVIRKDQSSLDKGALAYAVAGAAMNDALISCFQSKYQYNVQRPITYIREVMGFSTWNSFIGTPAHPEYASAHASLSAAIADVLQRLFGNQGPFTDHTYDYLGLAPRTFANYTAIGEEAGQSRVYAGIHYQPTVHASLIMGKQVTANIFSLINP
jgi:hypothetical protein